MGYQQISNNKKIFSGMNTEKDGNMSFGNMCIKYKGEIMEIIDMDNHNMR